MVRGRVVMAAVASVGALAVPAAASAAPTVAASAVPGMPQDCQAGCIGSQRLTCAATDALSIRTTVRCWTRSTNVFSATRDAPVAALQTTTYNSILGTFELCVEGIALYRDGTTASSGVHCSSGDDLGVAVVAG